MNLENLVTLVAEKEKIIIIVIFTNRYYRHCCLEFLVAIVGITCFGGADWRCKYRFI